jgi:hypothetical protein
MKAIKKNYLLKGQFARAMTAEVLGRNALATAVSPNASPRRRSARLRIARRMARQLEREKMPYTTLFAYCLRAGIASATGERTRAASLIRIGIQLAEENNITLRASALRYQLGRLLGGETGRRLAQRAEEEMTALGVRFPTRFANLLAPGIYDAAESSPPRSH